MNKLALSAALAATATLTSFAEEATKSSYSVTVDFPYTSKYVFRGIELAKDSLQPSVELSTGPVYLGVWTSQPVTNNTDNEFDFYAGYKYQLNDSWDVDVGATVYYYPELDRSTGGKRSTTEGYIGVNGNIKGFTPGLYTYRDVTLDTTTVQAQVGYSLPIANLGLSLDLSANAGRVFNDHGGAYTYWSTGVNVPYKIAEKSTVYAGVNYSNSNITGIARDLVSFTAGISIGF